MCMLLLAELVPGLSCALMLTLDRLLLADCRAFFSSWVGGIEGPVACRESTGL